MALCFKLDADLRRFLEKEAARNGGASLGSILRKILIEARDRHVRA